MRKTGWNSKYNLKVEPIGLAGRLDEVGQETRVSKDDLSNWTDDDTIY